jgi:hypothetical protein
VSELQYYEFAPPFQPLISKRQQTLGGVAAISSYTHSMAHNNQLGSATNLTNTDLSSLFIERLINNTQYEKAQRKFSGNSDNKIAIDTFDPPDNQSINDQQSYSLGAINCRIMWR